MAYKTEIQIGVKGVRELTQLQKNLDGTSYKIDEINKNQVKAFGGIAQSLNNYVKQLNQAERALKKVAAGTAQETRAINNYVTALGNANAAKDRQNRLIQEEIGRRSRATAELVKYNAAAAAPRPAGGSMTQRYIRPGSPVAATQYDVPIGPSPDQHRAFMQRTDAAAKAASRLTAEFLRQQREARNLANAQLKINSADFLERTDAAARKAHALTAEYAKQLRVQKEAAKLAESRIISPTPNAYPQPIGPMPKGVQGGAAGALGQLGAFGLGAGFPLLFGGGAGQVIGGAVGTGLAKAFGLAGEAAMGIQIAMSAIVGKAEELVRRFTEVGNAIRSLDMDALAQSFVTVTASTRELVRNLIQAGEAQAAVSVAANETFQQTGVLPEAVSDITNNVNLLSNVWDEFVGSVSGLVSIISAPLLTALTAVLKVLAMALKAVNLIASGAGIILKKFVELIAKIPGLDLGLKLIEKTTKGIVEEEEKGLDTLRATSDQLETEYRRNQELYNIESKRTAGRTAAEKLINAELERNKKLKELEFATNDKIKENREKYGQLTGKQAEIEQNYAELMIQKNAEIERQRINQTYELEKQNLLQDAQKEKVKEIKDTLALATEQLEGQRALIDACSQSLEYQAQINQNNAAVDDARRQAASDLLTLEISRLERAKDESNNLMDKVRLTDEIFRKKKQQALLEYQAQLSSIQQSVAKAEQERIQVRIKEQQLLLQIEQLRLEAQSIIDTNERSKALDRIFNQQRATLQIIEDMNRAADSNLQSTRQIAQYQRESASYAYIGKIEALETAQANQRNSMFLQQAQQSMQSLATSSNSYANNMQRATGGKRFGYGPGETPLSQATLADVESGAVTVGFGPGELSVSKYNRLKAASAYAKGGFVNGAEMALVGEGGPEYIVPEKKAAAFATNYLMGARGSAAIPRYAEGGYVGPVSIQTGPVTQMDGTNYVTTRDLSMAVQAGIQQTLDLISRDGNTRSMLGLS